MWLAVNHLPRTDDHSKGFWRRVRVLPFTKEFPINKRLKAELMKESEGILAWLVAGCLAWQGRGLEPPETVLAATERYRMDTAQLKEFIDQACAVDLNYSAGAKDLYKVYRQWCEEQSFTSKEIFSVTRFGRQLGDRFRREHTKNGAMYHGVGISGQLVTGLALDIGGDDGFDPTFPKASGKSSSRGYFPTNPSNPSPEAKNPSPHPQREPSDSSPTHHSFEWDGYDV